jgi:hypothetical protein
MSAHRQLPGLRTPNEVVGKIYHWRGTQALKKIRILFYPREPIASAPEPLERSCGERFGLPPDPSHPPSVRSVGCPSRRVGTPIVVHVIEFM